jgi:hypothetical protein
MRHDDDGVAVAGSDGKSTTLNLSQADFKALSEKYEKERKGQGAWPCLINMSMRKSRIHLPVGATLENIECPPFARTPCIPPDTAAAFLRRPSSSSTAKSDPLTFWLDPRWWQGPDGQIVQAKSYKEDNGEGCREVEDRVVGGSFVRCDYADCPKHPRPKGVPYSIAQAHQFMLNLHNVEAIQYFMRLDPRTEVTRYGQAVIAWRERLEAEKLGIKPTSRAPTSAY